MKNGTVYLIPSAIAIGVSQENLTPQVREALLNTRHYVAEHSREARRFISSLRLGLTIEDLIFNELDMGIADPGADIVREAHKTGLKVVPLVGPSSIVLALMASGLSGQNFRFTGYLPIDKKDLKNKINALENQSRREKETQIFIETPYRTDKLLQQLIITLNPATLLTMESP